MARKVYWVNEDGREHTTTKKMFSLWLKEFCTHVTTNTGHTLDKHGARYMPVKHINCGYNPQGVKICGVMEQ
jgi:hypothetical protein